MLILDMLAFFIYYPSFLEPGHSVQYVVRLMHMVDIFIIFGVDCTFHETAFTPDYWTVLQDVDFFTPLGNLKYQQPGSDFLY